MFSSTRLDLFTKANSKRYHLRIRKAGEAIALMSVTTGSDSYSEASRFMVKVESTIKLFALDRPEATLEELREHIKGVATNWLAQSVKEGEGGIFIDQCHEAMLNLRHIAASMSLTIEQHKAINEAVKMLKAAQGRLNGESIGLVGYLEEQPSEAAKEPTPANPTATSSKATTTFQTLSDTYLSEHRVNLKESSISDLSSSYKTLTRFTEGLNLSDYSRADLVALRDSLVADGFAQTTINKLLTKLSTVIGWAVMNGYINKDFSIGLKLRGAESQRKAFSEAQMVSLTDGLKSIDKLHHRYLVALGAITGARIGELTQLNPKDIREESGIMVIDINSDNGKSVKNRSSIRVVPLTAGAYGFNLEEFKEWVAGLDADKPILKMSRNTASTWFNTVYCESILGVTTGLTFHSLRHSMAGSLKAAGVNLVDAQGVLGHSSQSLAFDLYGKGHAVERLADALKVALVR